MRIEISLDERDPPTGHVVSGSGGEQRPFAGWLGLLAALAELVDGSAADEPAASRGAPGGEGSELDA